MAAVNLGVVHRFLLASQRGFARVLVLGSLLVAAGMTAPAAAPVPTGRTTEELNRDWRFARGSQPGAETPDFSDTGWETVRVPHDWAISGAYDPESDPHTGKLPWRGEGWYRRILVLPACPAGTRVYLDFDGVMAMPVVYLNGRKAGGWDYGYTSFRVDATEFVRFGATNLLAVHVDTRTHQSRWYPGAGIYRKVRLVLCDPVHVAHWGVAITTPEVSAASATIQVETTVENHLGAASEAVLETSILDPSRRTVAVRRSRFAIPAGAAAPGVERFVLPDPQRWDLETPRLYAAVTRVVVGDRIADVIETPFGLRTFEFTADDGFHLNGRRVQLQGVNLHHDHGPLGAAFLVRAMERQLEIMKDMGANAIRTSHNPPAPELLDLCDRLGFVVWDEAFDKWDGTATRPADVSMADHGRRQIVNLVRRDRNHPSVVTWSVGNEIWDLEGLKIPDSPGLLRQMVGFVKEIDPTRPVTMAHCVPQSANSPLDDSLDVVGWNYARRYAISREKRPGLPIIYSESASAFSTRGHYELPHPALKDEYPTSLRISSYDRQCAFYSDPADVEFALMERDRFVAGEFVWTGFDYLGEPAPFIARGWGAYTRRAITPAEESRISSFGIVDLVGLPKDRFYLYRSHWAPEKRTVHLLPHWNWPDRVGSPVPVYVYTSGDAAELFLNGRSMGRRAKDPGATNVLDRYRLRWEDVAYEPGELRAVAYSGGKRLGEARVRTAGAPAALRLSPDRTVLHADGEDLSYVALEAVDREGTLCPLAMNTVTLEVTGPATLAGVGNGDHHFPAAFVTNRVALFYGRAMAIVRSGEGGRGRITVRATSKGLEAAGIRLRSERVR